MCSCNWDGLSIFEHHFYPLSALASLTTNKSGKGYISSEPIIGYNVLFIASVAIYKKNYLWENLVHKNQFQKSITGSKAAMMIFRFQAAKLACEKLKKSIDPISKAMNGPKWSDLVLGCFFNGVDLSARHM